jgi:uncharacterized protein with von Willebrand factor type A (vWA) domain
VIERFGAALRAAGLSYDVAALRAYGDALRGDPDLGPFGLYWYARLTLVRSVDDVPAFDRVFTAFWRAEPARGEDDVPGNARGSSIARPASPTSERETTVAVDTGADDASMTEETTADALVTASERERLRERDFANFSEAEWQIAERLLRERPAPEAYRPSRRFVLRRHGSRLDVGATLREEQRSFGMRVRPRYRVRSRVLRPLAFVCDVSGSMAPYGRALLQYAFVLSRIRPKVATFAFGTQLTDLTERFTRGPRRGFARAMRAIPDWGGGTLIGASLHAFNRDFAMRGRVRGATLLLVSDGAERSDPALVGREMAQLARAVRRIVWLNPRKSDPAYEPLVRGMAAALPSIDAFLAGHNLRSLDAVAAVISGASKDIHHA